AVLELVFREEGDRCEERRSSNSPADGTCECEQCTTGSNATTSGRNSPSSEPAQSGLARSGPGESRNGGVASWRTISLKSVSNDLGVLAMVFMSSSTRSIKSVERSRWRSPLAKQRERWT